MDTSHWEFVASESAALLPNAWDRWIAKAEKLIGHDLDGNDSEAAKADGTAVGYSLDEAHDKFRAGVTPQAYVTMVATRERYSAPKAGS